VFVISVDPLVVAFYWWVTHPNDWDLNERGERSLPGSADDCSMDPIP
jgi:hypothetical protein